MTLRVSFLSLRIFSRLFLKEPSTNQAVTDDWGENQVRKKWVPLDPRVQVYEKGQWVKEHDSRIQTCREFCSKGL